MESNGSRVYTEAFKKNKNYRRYASSIERALSLFDSALQEWADYISFLSRLLKVMILRDKYTRETAWVRVLISLSFFLYNTGAPIPPV